MKHNSADFFRGGIEPLKGRQKPPGGPLARTCTLLAAILFAGAGCGGMYGPGTGNAANSLTIAAWNVEALFDGEETGTEYDEYRGPGNWNKAKYNGRITTISEAINVMGAPDLLALEEVENVPVLEDLMRGAGAGYRYSFFAKESGAALGLGVISRLPFAGTKTHSVVMNGDSAPRPMLEILLEHNGAPMVIFICHWKSKLGGDEKTELTRRASAFIIARRTAEIQEESPGCPVLILGDLNENHDEFYRQAGLYPSALLPDDPEAAAISGQGDFIVLSQNKPPRGDFFPPGTAVFYSPWTGELDGGSYYYKNSWETIDHILLSAEWFDSSGWEFSDCAVIRGDPFTGASGLPAAYNPRTGYGLSDHLPLAVTVVNPGAASALPP
ncbi:MAG: endonuclease/exonuclease/phosphatase family protein [Spirochaetaceae bacterium]|jgi:endonuclease/exonuclease/phosphatase family metal-dependent hydrolase|nr:endonuclease/exonuclease/phosphatase family protein [Spirochaetaceae bacterium]